MYIPKQTILEESLRREIERICFADTLMNKVVYDCSDPSPFTKVTSRKMETGYRPFDSWTRSVTILHPSIKGRHHAGFWKSVWERQPTQGNTDVNLTFIVRCEYEYNLILKPDYYTTMNTQWFYFSISNTRKDVEYRFNIVNMMKPDSLYNSGMKPLMYSDHQARVKSIKALFFWDRLVSRWAGDLLLHEQHEAEERGLLLHTNILGQI